MRAFVTGLDGFAGQWLGRELMQAGDEVAGGSRSEAPQYALLDASEAQAMKWYAFDLLDVDRIERALREWRPDHVYHLAAQAFVGDALRDPTATFRINAIGTAAILEAARRAVPDARVLYVGSADAYGPVEPSALPLLETMQLRPANPYAASKACGETIAVQYAHASMLDVVATRSFNHTGPSQRPAFAVSGFAKQIAEIASGRARPPMRVGNLDARRDYTDVRDVVRAYRLLMSAGESGVVYNVCRGESVSMRSLVDDLISIAGSDVPVVVDPSRLRPSDTADIVGDNARLRSATGWQPKIALATTLRDVYAYWAQVRISAPQN